MIEKLTVAQFHQIRSQLHELISRLEELYETHKYNDNYNYDSAEQEIKEQYAVVQERLLSYNLSDIPFEEWNGFQVLSDTDYRADFSKTKANIDFEIIEYSGNTNFKGCNVRNLERLKRWINPKDFDEQTIQNNAHLFLSDIFTNEFKEKYYSNSLTVLDLSSLTKEQLEEIEQKDYQFHLSYEEYSDSIFKILGLQKSIMLYNYSKQDYETVCEVLDIGYGIIYDFDFERKTIYDYAQIITQIKNVEVSEIKNELFNHLKRHILNTKSPLRTRTYPKSFIKENADIFLVNVNIPTEVQERYFNRNLTIKDLINHFDVFKNIEIDYFMEQRNYVVQFIKQNYGPGKFQQLVKKHPDVFLHIEEKNDFYKFNDYFIQGMDLEKNFTMAVKNYFLEHEMLRYSRNGYIVYDVQANYDIPEWLSSMNFKLIEKINSVNDLLAYKDNIIILDDNQRLLVDTLNIDNIIKFEKEIGFFSHGKSSTYSKLPMFEAFTYYFRGNTPSKLVNLGIDFKNGTLSYEDFLNEMAKCLDNMRKNNIFLNFENYDWIQGEFRDNHPEIFMDLDAPTELKNAFYCGTINPDFLYEYKEYIPYLINKNLLNSIRANIKLNIAGPHTQNGIRPIYVTDFIDEYASRYGNEKLLRLFSKYGAILSNIEISSFNGEIDNEQAIEKNIRNAMYNKIVKGTMDYSYLFGVSEFALEYPEIFVDFNKLENITQEEKDRLEIAFYSRTFVFDYIKRYPELVDILKNKNLQVVFSRKDGVHINGRVYSSAPLKNNNPQYSDLELLEVYGNEKFLELCSKYGRYMVGIAQHLSQDTTIKKGKYYDKNSDSVLSFDVITKKIEEIIIRESFLGNILYKEEDAPIFLKEKHPELFLSEDAPISLKSYFYCDSGGRPLTFELLHENKEWLPYLKNKSIYTALLRNSSLKNELIKYFRVFGDDKAIKLGIAKPETVTEMMRLHKVDLMKSWYDKTGGRFIPDFVVMQNFSLEDADKFLTSGFNWSNLMKNKNFARTPESRDAVLKLAYSFGAFDQDQKGFKKLQELLTGLPKKIRSEQGYIFNQIDEQINQYSQKGYFFKVRKRICRDSEGTRYIITESDLPSDKLEEAYEQMIDYVRNNKFLDLFDNATLLSLLESLKKENVDIDFSKDIFAQLYRKNEDGSYTLTINQQNYPKTSKAIRDILEKFRELSILTPDKAHQLFGGFDLKYDPDFREFLLANIDEIFENPEYVSFVSSVQRQFSDIKAVNSNRVLTWELAISYVQSNKYTSVEVGNERVAEISAIAGYSQADFNTLQQIYNYGKQRTFSSIPRIQKKDGKYSYEILRLDDPLAMAIGTLTDCCQELGDCAEVCMQHSMVDKNGRVFVIKDNQGNIVAQSWVWRNKDVLCFDNIEIPDKAFARAIKENPEIGRKGFTDEVYNIYKQAARDLMEEDERVYKELFDSGKISQEQYEGLRLGKITVGLGFNDIAESLKQNSFVDKGTISRPLPFEEPVKLSRGLYINDSVTQYVLEELEDRKEFHGETLSLHSDDYTEYSDSNFTEKSLLSLEKLEIVTKGNVGNLDTAISDYADSEHLVSEIATNYGLNPYSTRIVMNPNFAIIFDVNDNKLKIGDLLFNTKIENEYQQIDIENQVVMQIRVALDQISNGKEIDVSLLSTKQKEIYTKAISLTDEIDIERGIRHAR